MIQVHAITRGPVRIGDLPGTEERSLREVDCGEISALVSERDGPAEPSAADVIAHAELIEAVSRAVDTLPVRFGILYRDEDRLRASLRDREDEFVDLLDRIAGRVEFVVRGQHPSAGDTSPQDVAGDPSPEDAQGPGRAYLEGRLAQHRASAAEREELEARLERIVAHVGDLVVEEVAREGRNGPERCVLVEREDAERFAQAASRGVEEAGGLVLGGPWPPYTFAETSP